MEIKWVMIAIAVSAFAGSAASWLIEREEATCVVELSKLGKTAADINSMCRK